MNVGLIMAGECNYESFYHKDGRNYFLSDDKPYFEIAGIKDMLGLPMPFNGTFIRWASGLPDIDLDVLFVCIDKDFIEYRVSDLRAKYPNTVLVAYTREKSPIYHMPPGRIDFFNQCDKVACPYGDKVIDRIRSLVDKKVYSFPYPYDIEGIRKKHYREAREFKIMVGCNTRNPRRLYRDSLKFARKIASICPHDLFERPNYGWDEWLDVLSECALCINLDPMPEIGQVPIECAILSVAHFGSELDAAKRLWSQTANNNTNYLTDLIVSRDYLEMCDNALESVRKIYSYDAARENLKKLMED